VKFERLYTYRFRDVDQGAREAVWREIAAFVYEAMGRPQRVLDPAAGLGEFINNVPAPERWAVDQSSYVGYRDGVKTVIADIFEADLPSGHFDGVWVSNFLEHLTSQEDVARFLERMRSVMAVGGRIVIMGPNFRYCAKQYFDMADHTIALTHRAVAEHVYAAGFEPESVEARFLPYSFTGRLPPSPVLTRHYLRMRPAWRLLGRQFLVVASA
jgi:hypothetical protein